MSRNNGYWPPARSADATERTHKIPARLRVVLGALIGCLLALACAVGVLLVYILDVREYRDRQFAEQDEQIRVAICDLLDQLPDGGLLERPRDKYGCGPGYPPEEIDPQQREEQREIAGRNAVPPPPPRLRVPPIPRERLEARENNTPVEKRPSTNEPQEEP